MNKKQYLGFIILGITIFGVIFYWYSLRPSIIKKDCYVIANEEAIKKLNSGDRKFLKDDYDAYYKWCLNEKGL